MIEYIISKIKKFRGVKIKFFDIYASTWHGYGFSFLSTEICYTNGGCMLSYSKSLFHFSVYNNHENGSETIGVFATILFFWFKVYEKQIKPKWDKCEECGYYCSTKEFYQDGIALCSEDCKYCHNL